ncbi:MAG: restriction endonuclease subunit S [Bacilli bacterium]|nr:restriction endonuclease subunit S [Bacilli bacterium]
MNSTLIGNVLNLKRGYDLTKEQMEKGRFPVAGSNGIIGYHNISNVSKPVITVGRSGTVGIPHIYYEDCWVHNTALYIDDFKGNNPEYLYYLLKELKIDKVASSTGVPTLNRNFVHPLKIYYEPDVDKQKNIARILRNLDLKIENNLKINAQLISLVETIYDYWFLQFDFPNDEGKPYQSSGGEMIWNSKLNRKIPLGWEIDKLKNITSIALGGTPSRSKKEYWENGTINWLNSGEISNFPIVTSNEKITLLGLENSSTEYMEKGTVVVSITGNIRVSILGINSCANQSVVGISESDLYKKEYIFPAISMLIDQFNRISTGNCQQHINKRTLEQSYTLIPPEHILRKYYQEVELMYNEIINNAHQNFELSELRDFLSPLLLNGQVIIK